MKPELILTNAVVEGEFIFNKKTARHHAIQDDHWKVYSYLLILAKSE